MSDLMTITNKDIHELNNMAIVLRRTGRFAVDINFNMSFYVSREDNQRQDILSISIYDYSDQEQPKRHAMETESGLIAIKFLENKLAEYNKSIDILRIT